jgi:gluconolactonase
MTGRSIRAAAAAATLLFGLVTAAGATPVGLTAPDGKPDAIVDLRTREGVQLVQGAWRYSDARLIDVDFNAAGADMRPSGPPLRTQDVEPKAGAADFNDSSWQVLDPTTLEGRRSTGRVAFNWYRVNVTVPETVGALDPTGATLVFEIVVDDYAEVWVDGQLPRPLGQSGGPLVAGYNVPNRVVLGRDVRPGQQFQIAVFGINGPVSDPPANYIWIRSATLKFYQAEPLPAVGEVVRLDPALDRIIPAGARIEQVAEGFTFGEGPVWDPAGALLLSDPNENMIYRWTEDGGVAVFRANSGYTGTDIGQYGQPGSNGLTFDPQGRLTIAEHGNHRISRLEKNGALTVLADSHEGRRLNSPNDLVYRSDGTLYFTDPPFGLPAFFDDPRKELPYSGVFSWQGGRLRLEATDLTGPNGVAFSPDEKFLYVTNWDTAKKVVMRYPVNPDGRLGTGEVFFDMTSAPGEEALDGVKVDQAGNLYVSGPGGAWIISPEGRHLGMLEAPELPANFAWGDADGRTLYLTARSGSTGSGPTSPASGPSCASPDRSPPPAS